VATPEAATLEFVVVRHAEKEADGTKDPALTAAGRERAQRLVQHVGEPLVAAYATGFRRTQQTAAPTAAARGIAVATYDAAQPEAAFAATLRERHTAGTVLVVGHSNTVPGIVATLCGCDVGPIGDNDYDRLYRVRIADDGRAALQLDHY
jgi:broad specificity phosphatase PhoE